MLDVVTGTSSLEYNSLSDIEQAVTDQYFDVLILNKEFLQLNDTLRENIEQYYIFNDVLFEDEENIVRTVSFERDGSQYVYVRKE